MEISNSLTGSFYTLPGDINGDGIVNEVDPFVLTSYIGLRSSNAAYRPWYDTDGDGEVTEADASLIGYAFGNFNPAPSL
jgi:hypothetical protein